MTAPQSRGGSGEISRTLRTGRHREHTEAMKTESVSVDVLLPRRLVGEELSREGTLGERLPRHRHRAPVGLQEIERPITAGGLVKYGTGIGSVEIGSRSVGGQTAGSRMPLGRSAPPSTADACGNTETAASNNTPIEQKLIDFFM